MCAVASRVMNYRDFSWEEEAGVGGVAFGGTTEVVDASINLLKNWYIEVGSGGEWLTACV